MTMFKESLASKETDDLKTKQETDRPEMKNSEIPRMPKSEEINERSCEETSNIYDDVFKKSGLLLDSTDNTDGKEENANSPFKLEKNNDGKYCDKESGKVYDSPDEWRKEQETLAKRYDGTADFYEKKAQREWARYKNADENGESAAEKWEHYRNSQECYSKAKECREKANAIKEKLSESQEGINENPNQKETESKPFSAVPE